MPDLCLDATSYFTGTRAVILVGVAPITPAAPTIADLTITTSAAAIIGATTLTVSALTKKLQRGDRLKFGSTVVQLDDPAIVGATTLLIKPALSAIASGATATTQEYVPYMSAATVDFQINGEKVEMRNLGACDWASAAKTKLSATLNFDGNLVARVNDEGGALLRAAAGSTTNRHHIKLIEPDGSMLRGNFWVESLGRKIGVDAAVTQTLNLTLDGAPIYGTATDLVLA
jgi:hypothetical protein